MRPIRRGFSVCVAVVALALSAPLFAQQYVLQSDELYSTTALMQGDGYTLSLKETGALEAVAASGDGYVLDPYPYNVRDLIPPSRPQGLQAASLDGSTVRLVYEASSDNVRVLGYKIFRDGVQVGFTAEDGYTVSGLVPMRFYHYSVQAVDKGWNLSEMSEAVWVLTMDSATADNPPHFLSRPSLRYVSATTAVIGFVTDKATRSVVEYGTSSSYGNLLSVEEYESEHLVSLTGLSAGTRYHYRVSVSDYSGHAPVTSPDDSFLTRWDVDATPPGFTEAPTVSYLSDSIATISFQTDEDALASVSYGPGGVGAFFETEADYAVEHCITLSGLAASTLYRFQVSITDRAYNGPVASAQKSFRTAGKPDAKGPVILGKPRELWTSDTLAIIGWDTDEISTGVVSFGEASELYDRQASSSTLGRSHLVVLANLEGHHKYYYTVVSTDPSGNTSEGVKERQLLSSNHPDTRGPKIQRLEVRPGVDGAVVLWQTDELAQCKLLFGAQSGSFAGQLYEWKLSEEHRITLSGLSPGTAYYFQLIAVDPAGNQTQTRQYSLRTLTHDNQHDPHHDDGGHHMWDWGWDWMNPWGNRGGYQCR